MKLSNLQSFTNPNFPSCFKSEGEVYKNPIMRIAFFFICLIVLQNNTIAQEWIRYYGQGQKAVCRSIINDYDKGFVIGGMINNYTYSWIFKTDINGNKLWDKQFGNGVYSCGLGNVEITSDGGYVFCGSWQKEDTDFDVFILKLNTCGEIEWCKTLYTPGHYELCGKIKTTPEGDYILAANYFETNPASRTSLFKFNSSGNLIWQQFYPLDSVYYQDDVMDFTVDSSGYLITAFRYAPDSGTVAPIANRSYFFKTDTSGVKQWELVYGTNKHFFSVPWTTVSNSSGNYIHSCTHSAESTNNPALIFVDKTGSTSTDKDILTGNSNFCGFQGLATLDETNIILFGGLWDDSHVWTDYALKTDNLGNLIKQKALTSASNSYCSSVKTSDAKFIAVANDYYNNSWRIVAVKVNSDLEYDSIYTQPFTYDSLCPHPIVSDTIDPNCDNVIVSVDEPFKKPETTQLKVYPNPAKDRITVELPKYLIFTDNNGSMPVTTVYHQWQKVVLQAIDLNGKIILSRELQNNNETVQIDVSRWTSGSYLFRMIYNGKQVAGSKVVVK